MARVGFAFPLLPGKEEVVRKLSNQVRARMSEYEESRRRAELTLERSWLQRNPDGSALVVVYGESGRSYGDVLKTFLTGSDFDRWFLDVNEEISGVNFRAPQPGAEPEQIAAWQIPAPGRGRGFAFAAPLGNNKAEEAKRFAKEAYQDRKSEMDASRKGLGLSQEHVFLNRTPMGDIAVVYIEGDDPVEANRRWAGSQDSFDRWFKDRCKEVFAPGIDFNQPVPRNEPLWDWQAKPS